MRFGGRRNKNLRGAGAFFHANRLGPGEQAGLGGISGRVSAHSEIAGGNPVEDEASFGIGFRVTGAVAGFEFDDGGDRRADVARIVR